jgi:hypothetical protein
MSGRARIDYKEAERRFVVEDHSLRQIATDMGLKSNSSISAVARRDDWVGKRAAYKAAIARRSYEVSAAAVANEGKTIRDETILAARASIRTYLNDLKDGKVQVSSKDAKEWASWLLVAVASGGEANSEAPDVKNVTPPDMEQLRRLVEAARGRVSPAGSLGPDPLVQPANPRPD